VPEAVARTLALDGSRADMYLLRGLVYAKRGDLSRAAPELLRAIDLNPKSADAWANLSHLQRLLGREEESRQSRRRALKIDSGRTP
jgi:Tfp pilus assembly protein PilF